MPGPIFVQRFGAPAKGPTLVFLHEALGSVRHWKDFPDALCAATGLPGLAYDRLGHGDSGSFERPRGKDYLHVEAEKLGEILEGVEGPVVLVGHSDGGTIALLRAASHPDGIAGVIAEASHVFNDDFTLAGVRETVGIYAQGKLPYLLAQYHGDKTDAVFRAWHQTWLAPWFKDWDVRDALPKVRAPVLAIQGAEDRYGTREQLDAIGRGVPRCETALLAGCGHAPHHQARAETLERMAGFIRALPRRA
jgi:pimeloyl-ACP methyl ester carboxylesterase